MEIYSVNFKKVKTVKIISESNDWIEITYNGESGWISSQYIQENNSEDTVNTSNNETFTSGELTILHNGTNIRKRPNTQSTILDRANQGDTFETISFENDWYQIKLENEQIGYVASWLVSTEDAIRPEGSSNPNFKPRTWAILEKQENCH